MFQPWGILHKTQWVLLPIDLYLSLIFCILNMEQEIISLSEAKDLLDKASTLDSDSDVVPINDPGEFATTEEYLAISEISYWSKLFLIYWFLFLGHKKCSIDDCIASKEATQIRNRARDSVFWV